MSASSEQLMVVAADAEPWLSQRSTARRSRWCWAACLGGQVAALVVASVLAVWWVQQKAPMVSQAPRAEFNATRALAFANLAGAAYCSPAALEAWDCGDKCIPGVEQPVRVCPGETTQAFVATWEGLALVSFQGTKSMMSMIQDLRFDPSSAQEFCDKCSVHTGFLYEWQSLADCVKDALTAIGSPTGTSIRVSGHSLGGAVTSIAMVDLTGLGWTISEAYTFGMPRVGNLAFSQYFASLFNIRSGAFYRVTYHMDPVPHVPPEDFGFYHLIPEIFFARNFSTYVVCFFPEDDHCAGQFSNLPEDILHAGDHLVYMGTNTSSSDCAEPPKRLVVAGPDIVV